MCAPDLYANEHRPAARSIMSVPGPHPDGEVRLSDNRRTGAYIVDLAILALATFAIGVVRIWLGFIRPEVIGWQLDPASLILDLPLLVVPAIYFIGCWTRGGHTIGMRLCGLRVVRDDDLGILTWRAALVRWLALQGVVLMVTLFIDRSVTLIFEMEMVKLAWIAILWLSTRGDPLSRGFHDRVSGSRVVRLRRAAEPDVR